ncbi:cysteine hydrolase family protein [soil metagenome]
MSRKDALLVIDVQVAMVEDDPNVHNVDNVLTAIRSLIDKSREASVPVVYVQHIEPEYARMQPGNAGFDVHPALAPTADDAFVHKRTRDSFYGTDLKNILEDLGATRLVVTGMQTEMCVSYTSRSAVSHGYDVTLVADGHTTSNRDNVTGQQLIEIFNESFPEPEHPDRTVNVQPSAEIAFHTD